MRIAGYFFGAMAMLFVGVSANASTVCANCAFTISALSQSGSNVNIQIGENPGFTIAVTNDTSFAGPIKLTISPDEPADFTNLSVSATSSGGAMGDLLASVAIVEPFSVFFLISAVDFTIDIIGDAAIGVGSIGFTVSAVPLPGAAWLFGTALLGGGIVVSRRRRRRATAAV